MSGCEFKVHHPFWEISSCHFVGRKQRGRSARVVQGDPAFLEEGRRLWQMGGDGDVVSETDLEGTSESSTDADASSSAASSSEDGCGQLSVVVLFVPTPVLAEYHAQASSRHSEPEPGTACEADPSSADDTESSTSEPEPWLPFYVVGHTSSHAQASKALGAVMRGLRDRAAFVPVTLACVTPDGAITPM